MEVSSKLIEPTIKKDLNFRHSHFEKCEREKDILKSPFFAYVVFHNSPSPSSCSSIDFNNIQIGGKK